MTVPAPPPSLRHVLRLIAQVQGIWWVLIFFALLLSLDWAPEVWRAIGFPARYQIIHVAPRFIVRLDTKTGQLDVFLLGTSQEAEAVAPLRLIPIAKP